jgi:PKD repeat protein
MKSWNSNGSDSIVKTNYIVVGPAQAPAVAFSADKTVLCEGNVVHFQDESDYCPTNWVWEFTPSTFEFVQGTSANSQNPIVQFDAPGTYTVRLSATNPTGFNSMTKLNYIAYGGYNMPFSEGFETGFNTQSWTIQNSDNDKTWDTITVAGTSPGHLAAWIDLFEYNKVNRDQLISPPLNFTSYTSLELSFEHAYAQHSSIKDSLIVKISSDCGATWTRILAAGPDGSPNVFATHTNMATPFFPQSAYDWCGSAYGTNCYQLDISAWAGLRNVKILFESYNHRGNNIFLDNINVSGPTGISQTVSNGEAIRIYPNPTTGMVSLFISNPSSNVELSVINIQGQKEFTDQFSATSGNSEKQFNLSGLSKGVYFFRVTTDQSTVTKKVILE